MPDTAVARRLAVGAAMTGGGTLAVGGGLAGLVLVEARIARRLIGTTSQKVPDASGWYGPGRPGPALRVALLGDSSAAGYGVERVEQTPGAYLAAGLARRAHRRVNLRAFCRVGAQSFELSGQVERALRMTPDVAVVLVGANDVTHAVPVGTSVRALGAAVRRLREAGVEVVVGTCPDLGTVRPIPQPLRQLVRLWSRRLAARQTVATVREGGRSVSLTTILGEEFAAAPAIFFGPDRFHPSAAGYASLAAVMIPSVLAALGLAPEDENHPTLARGERVLSVEQAAADAVRRPGAEVDGTTLGETGAAGRWAVLMRRRRHAPEEAAPSPVEIAPPSETVPAAKGHVVDPDLDRAIERLNEIVAQETTQRWGRRASEAGADLTEKGDSPGR